MAESTTASSDPRSHPVWHRARAGILDSRFTAEPSWLIDVGRLIIAVFAAIAIFLYPTDPAPLAAWAMGVTLGYLAFSLLVLIAIRRPVDSKLHVLVHAIDITAIGWLLWLTSSLDSPFFAFFNFTLYAASIRWGMKGALLCAVVLELLLLISALSDIHNDAPELNVIIMRSAYVMVAAFMLGYLGAYRNRSRYRFARLAAWPNTSPVAQSDAWLTSILTHASEVLGASRFVVAWQDVDAITGTIAVHGGEGDGVEIFDVRDPAAWSTISGATAFRDGLSEEESGFALRARLVALLPYASELRAPARRIFSAGFSELQYRGRLLVLDPLYEYEEIESLVTIIAARIGQELERMALMHEIASNIREQERSRLARNLHDSVLQDLTAANLKLKSAAKSVGPETQPLLRDVAAIVTDQQRRIRRFVEDTRSGESRLPLTHALVAQVEHLEKQWDCEIHLAIEPPELGVSMGLSDDLAQILCEATSNAVRHGEANRIDFAVSRHGGMLRLGIVDNGIGIPEGMASEMTRPISLGGRVADLSGSLSITRRSPGLALLIEVPMS